MDFIYASLPPVFLVVPITLMKYGTMVTMSGTMLATLMIIIQSKCHLNHCTSLAIWCSTLSSIGGIGLLSHALAATLYYIDSLHGKAAWMKSLSPYFAISLLAVIVILTVMLLCAFGLERSSLLRMILSISLCLIILIMGTNMPISKWRNIVFSFPSSMPQVVKSTILTVSVFILLIVNTNINEVNRNIRQSLINTPSKRAMPLKVYTVFNFLTMSFVVNFITLMLSLYFYQPNMLRQLSEWANDTDVATIFSNILSSKWYRFAMLALIVVNLGLALPDMMISCSYYFTVLAGRMFPLCISREIPFTGGTQAICIVLSGFFTMPLSTTMSLEELSELITATYLLSNFLDIVHNINVNYQPLYYNKESGGSDDASYELLRSVQDDECPLSSLEQECLSEDSGHSSDTDIDAVVAEFKEKIKVATTMADPVISEPTLYTGRRVTMCLSAEVLIIILLGFAVSYKLFIVSSLSVVVILILVAVIYWQPSRRNEKPIPVIPTTSYMIITSIFLFHFSTHVIICVSVWLFFGVVAWVSYNLSSNTLTKYLNDLKQKMRRNNGRVSFSRQSSRNSLTLVDTVHIIR